MIPSALFAESSGSVTWSASIVRRSSLIGCLSALFVTRIAKASPSTAFALRIVRSVQARLISRAHTTNDGSIRELSAGSAVRREILDAICLNRSLSASDLYFSKRKPFDAFENLPEMKQSRGDCHSFEPLLSIFAELASLVNSESSNVARVLRISA